MSHRILANPGIQLVQIAWNQVSGETNPTLGTGDLFWGTDDVDASWGDIHQYVDPVNRLFDRSALLTDAIDARYAFGLIGFTDPDTELIIEGSDPLNVRYNGRVDNNRHGTFWSGLYSVLRSRHQRRLAIQGEHEVRHLNFHGRSVASEDFTLTPPFLQVGVDSYENWGRVYYPFVDGTRRRRGIWDASQQLFTGTYGTTSNTNDIHCWTIDVANEIATTVADYGHWSWWTYGNVRKSYDIVKFMWAPLDDNLGGLSLDYIVRCRTYAWKSWETGKWFEFDIRVKRDISLLHLGPINPATISGNYLANFHLLHTLHEKSIVGVKAGPDWDSDDVDNYNTSDVIAWIVSRTFQPATNVVDSWDGGAGPLVATTLGSTQPVDASTVQRIIRDATDLRKQYSTNHLDLTSACFYSATDALDKFVKVVGTNHIETLSELTGIAGLLPNLGGMIRFFRAVRAGNIGMSIREGLDFYTGSELLWAFGWRPTISAAKEFATEYDRVVAQINEEGIWGGHTLNGKFTFDFPEESIYGPVHMEVRTKMRVAVDDTTLLTLLFKGAAVGLIPSLSGFWDCVPFSFVLDWFTGIGDRFDDIDAQGRLFLITHHFSVHSIKLTASWTPSYMESRGITAYPSAVSTASPMTTYYHRWLSFILPTLRPSKYDFRPIGGVPSLRTAGCLAYQVLT